MSIKEFIIDGNNFSDIDGFYDEIDRLLTKDLDFKTGHSLNAFEDILIGGFGVHEPQEPIILKWINYKKSKKDLGIETILEHIEAILNGDNFCTNCQLQLYDYSEDYYEKLIF